MKSTDMRSLTPEARRARRVRVLELRVAGQGYEKIAAQTGLSRTGVFNICKRHQTLGPVALSDAPRGRRPGQGRTLTLRQEGLLRGLIVSHRPDALALPQALWTRHAVAELVWQRLGLHLPVRTLASYLARWGFAPSVALNKRRGPGSVAARRWLDGVYPLIEAASKAQDGEINWADAHPLPGGAGGRAPGPLAPLRRMRRPPAGPRRLSMIASVSNRGQLRWSTFVGALDAAALIDFLGRLIQGAQRKLFLITEGLAVEDPGPVDDWLLRHEDAIQTFQAPDPAPDPPPKDGPRVKFKPAA